MLFNCLCERSVNDDYIYREVIYDYELLEDYQDLNECHKQDVGSKQGSTKLEKFHDWGPKRYKYCTHPLYLMVLQFHNTHNVYMNVVHECCNKVVLQARLL